MGNSPSRYNFLLIGKVGNGKSSSANAIAEKEHFFAPHHSTQAITKTISKCQIKRFGHEITVVDTPGLADPELDELENAEFARSNMTKLIGFCHEGFHAFLIVLNFTNRFSIEEKNTIVTLTEIFGEKMFSSTILIFTHGDNFDKEKRVSDLSKSQQEFFKWCKKIDGDLEILLQKCNYRAVLFHNSEDYNSFRDLEIIELYKKVKELKKTIYTKSIFDKNEHKRKHMILNKYLPQLKSKIHKELSELKDDMKLITHQKEMLNKMAKEFLTKLEKETIPAEQSLQTSMVHLKDNFKSLKNNREKFNFLNSLLANLKGPILQEIGTLISAMLKISSPEKHKNELKRNVIFLLGYIKEQSLGTRKLDMEEERVKMFQKEVEQLDITVEASITEIQ